MAYGLPDYPRARADGYAGEVGDTTQRNRPWRDWNLWSRLRRNPFMGGGMAGLGDGGGDRGVANRWMPEMFSQIYGKLGTEQTAHRDWIKELMGLTRSTMADTTAGLARGLGSHMSRTNVPIPAGADIMARRYLSPMTQGLESQMAFLRQLLQQPQSRLGMATGLTQQMAPLFGGRGLPDLSQLWGGGR